MDPKYILLGQYASFGPANYVNLKNQQITFCQYLLECYNYRNNTTVEINNTATVYVFISNCSAAAHREILGYTCIHTYTVFILTLHTHI